MIFNNTTEKGRHFERRVGNLFHLLGYHVTYDRLIGGRQVDLVLEKREGPISCCYIVECKDQIKAVSTSQYDSFLGRLNVARKEIGPKTQGIMVASVAFVKEVIAQSAFEQIQLITISELEKTLIDFRQYITDLIEKLDSDSDLKYFVQPKVKRENLSSPEPVVTIIQKWLVDPIANQITLLGDYGTGKTTLLKELALSIARDYVKHAIHMGFYARVPMFIDLREHAKVLSLKQLILDFLDTNSIRASSYAAFEYMLREGHIVMIVDGFDEMASRGDPQATLRNFRELIRVATGKSKIILSCRTHYFTANHDLQRHHGLVPGIQSRGRTYTDLYREIAAKPNFVILYLQEFDEIQVHEYIDARCGKNSQKVVTVIRKIYNLPELSRRPVLLDMIVSSHGTLIGDKKAVSPSDLYAVYTDIWLQRNDWYNALDVQTKCILLEMFAKRVSENPGEQLHYREFPVLIRDWKKDVSRVDAEEIDRELRTASFLVRDSHGNYRFSHKSFFEYFYARFLLSDISISNGSAWEDKYFTTEVYRFLRELLASKKNFALKLIPWLNDTERDQYARTNAIKCLGGIQNEELENSFVDILREDKVERVRWSAATALYHYRSEKVVDQLIETLRSDSSKYVRSNCLIALARLNTQKSLSFLYGFLEGGGERIIAEELNRSAFYIGLRGCIDKTIIRKAIEKAPLKAGGKETIPAILELCRRLKTELAFSYCENLLRNTVSPLLTTTAFELLPIPRRIKFLNKLFGQITLYSGFPFVSKMIEALSGLKRNDVKAFLSSIVTNGKTPEAIIAFTLLRDEYEGEVLEMAPFWITKRGHPYQIRSAIANTYAELVGEGAAESLEHLLSVRERVIIQRTALALIQQHCPKKIVSSVMKLWNDGIVTSLAQYTLEILVRCEPEVALTLAIEKGFTSKTAGIRVAVCLALSELRSQEVTDKLIELLRNDHSVWVRFHALQSLCVPGRLVSRAAILKATENERNRGVLNLRTEFLGK